MEHRQLLATFTVVSSADSGPGTLREAIEFTNLSLGRDVIRFDLPAGDTSIRPLTGLPSIVDPVSIDGTTQPGYNNRPLVELSGLSLTGTEFGLKIEAGNSLVRGLVIHSFPSSGIYLTGNGGNQVTRNYIGTDPSGQTAMPNGQVGVVMDNSAHNLIGGSSVDANLISGNAFEGIRIEGAGSFDNKIQSNKIGSNATGDHAIPNLLEGILIQNSASGNTIGVDSNGINDSFEGNLISGNNRNGIRVFSAVNNTVAGNLIGIAADQSTSLRNQGNGVLIDFNSSNNLIGSDGDGIADALELNWIAGNGDGGIRIDHASNNRISGNRIGGFLTGQTALGNGSDGILLSNNANSNRIGSMDGIGLGNLISGNQRNGILISGSSDNMVAGNWIGTTLTGDTALGNAGRGIAIDNSAKRNRIGTNDNNQFDTQERNLISGNLRDGVGIVGSGTDTNIVAGNFIGTNSLGTSSLPNGATGLLISSGAFSNTIGVGDNASEGSHAGNLISGNSGYGVQLEFQASANSVAGNWIGSDLTGKLPIPNLEGGVLLTGAIATKIGNDTKTGSNRIAFNRQHAIVISGSDARSNNVSENSIFGNEGIPIDLNNDGVTANDPLDIDAGPNLLQNSPTVLMAASDGNQTLVFGSIDTSPNFPTQLLLSNASMPIRSFISANANKDADAFLNQAEMERTNAQGRGFWLQSSPVGSDLGQQVSANATDIFGNTSEFSAAQTIVELLPMTTIQSIVNENDGIVRASVFRGRVPMDVSLVLQLVSTDPASATVPSEIVILPGALSAQFDVKILDDHIYSGSRNVFVTAQSAQGVGALSIRVIEDDIYWHNPKPGLGLDVDDDGSMTPLDVLAIVNLLNTNFPRDLSKQPPLAPLRYIDTDNDGFLTPLDVLVLINYLNAKGNGESNGENSVEGESSSSESRLSQIWNADVWDDMMFAKRRSSKEPMKGY